MDIKGMENLTENEMYLIEGGKVTLNTIKNSIKSVVSKIPVKSIMKRGLDIARSGSGLRYLRIPKSIVNRIIPPGA